MQNAIVERSLIPTKEKRRVAEFSKIWSMSQHRPQLWEPHNHTPKCSHQSLFRSWIQSNFLVFLILFQNLCLSSSCVGSSSGLTHSSRRFFNIGGSSSCGTFLRVPDILTDINLYSNAIGSRKHRIWKRLPKTCYAIDFILSSYVFNNETFICDSISGWLFVKHVSTWCKTFPIQLLTQWYIWIKINHNHIDLSTVVPGEQIKIITLLAWNVHTIIVNIKQMTNAISHRHTNNNR